MDSKPTQGSAPGKVILFGEHAVVYGRPAIAVPVIQVEATANVQPAPAGSGLTIVAADLDERVALSDAPLDEPLALAARLTLERLSAPEPDATLTITSTIPIASGLGSGAAVSTALIRALARFLDHELKPADLSALVFEVEKIHHGTPSGLDNTVVAHAQPVYFVREETMDRLALGAPLTLLIADSGLPSPTGEIVAHVRQKRESEPAHYDALFDQIGEVTNEARQSMEEGDVDTVGMLMDQNHELLIDLDVSSNELDDLVETARFAGALGAKLSGAGRGGNVVALVEDELAEEAGQALSEAGAKTLIRTQVAAAS